MHTNQGRSSVGDWLFLVGGAVLVGGYLAYENQGAVQGWLLWIQSLGNAQVAPDGSLWAWVAANWGLVMLGGAMIFAALKLWAGGATIADAGPGALKYKSHNHVSVNLIR